ncbi:sulfatase-like hydrolase/transferase [Patescibacteria group bacterium AH-259-L05]|nr:sulfatase-like hydrolase/transferase [Patescibacteria group bacterium AH-259-L05]
MKQLPYNIILIVIDALRTENLSCYGYKKPTSPTIDSLARNGVIFENAYCCINHTDPSLTSMFTGRFPVSHGIAHHGTDVTEEEMKQFYSSGSVSIAQILKQFGYHTFAVSWLYRWHKRGFDFYGDSEKEIGLNKSIRPVSFIKSNKIRSIARKIFENVPFSLQNSFFFITKLFGVSKGIINAESMTNTALTLIKQLKKQDKFFLNIHYTDAHLPFDTIPKKYKQMFRPDKKGGKTASLLKRISNNHQLMQFTKNDLKGIKYSGEIESCYNAGIRYVDDEIKRLILDLKKNNIFDKTIFIITGDHGDNFLREGLFLSHFGLYEQVTHVPLILSGPGLPKRKKIKGFVQHTDMLPTVLELLGIDLAPYDFDGKNLLPLIKEENKSWPFAITMDGATEWRFALRTKKFKYILSPLNNDPCCKYGIGARDVEELYDLEKDPLENNNIAKTKKDIATEHKKILINWLEEMKDRKSKRRKNQKTVSIPPEEVYTKEEEEKLKEKLRNLGYID